MILCPMFTSRGYPRGMTGKDCDVYLLILLIFLLILIHNFKYFNLFLVECIDFLPWSLFIIVRIVI